MLSSLGSGSSLGFNLKVDISSPVSCTHDIAALTLLLWDTALTWGGEYRFVWSNACPVHLKWAFVLSRYLAITFQMLNVRRVWTTLSVMPLPIPDELCRSQFAFQLTAFRILAFIFEAVLGLRTYVMHKKAKRIGHQLSYMILGGAAASFACGTRLRKYVSFDAVCSPHSPPSFSFILIFSISMIRYILLGYLASTTNMTGRQRTSNSDLVRYIHTGSMLPLLSCIGGVLAVTQYDASTSITGHAVFVWPCVLTSMLCCHLILNMREVAVTSIGRGLDGRKNELPYNINKPVDTYLNE